jgi:hypothetical protein
MNSNLTIGLEQAQKIARSLFDGPGETSEIKNNYQDIVSAWYLWQPVRGGGAVLISSSDGTFLFANSAVTLDEHMSEFARGTRTDPSELEP